MRVFLVDDEPLAVKRLARLLDVTGRVTIAGSSSDPAQAVERMRASPVDAVFLDIEMPVLNGFQVLTKLDPPPLVVFTTAYDQYALRAFQVNSIDYLLKPVEPEQLDRALNKLERMLGGFEPRSDVRQLLSQITQALGKPQPEYLSRVASRIGERVELIDVHQVTHFHAQDKLTYAATGVKTHAIDPTIAELEARLDPRRFFRIHRATIVNLDYVKELYTWFAGRIVVRLKDGKTELPVARDRVGHLKEKLGL